MRTPYGKMGERQSRRAASAFPKYEVNLGTGGDIITETTGVPATNPLWHTPSRPSRLLIN